MASTEVIGQEVILTASNGNKVALNCGLSDYYEIVENKDYITVVSWNTALGYLGVDILDVTDMEKVEEWFFQDSEAEEYLDVLERHGVQGLLDRYF